MRALRQSDADTYAISRGELAMLLQQVFGVGLQIGMKLMGGDGPDDDGGRALEEPDHPAMDVPQSGSVIPMRQPSNVNAPMRRAARAIEDFERILRHG